MVYFRMAMVLCIGMLVGASGWTAEDSNLITNPGFEEPNAAGTFAAAWEPVYWSNPHGKGALSDEARTGKRCVVITGVPPAKITDGTPRNNNLIGHKVAPPIIGVRKLVLRAWFRCAKDATAYLSMITANKDGTQLQYVSSRHVSGQTEWAELVLPLTTAPETAQLTVYLRNDGEGPAWFDDVSLQASDDVLENDLLRVQIEPLLGGRLHAIYSKRQERDLTLWSGVRPGGMAAEIVPGDDYPGVLRDAACTIEVLEPRRRVLVTHGPAPGLPAGLVIEKEVALRAGAATLDVHLRVTNTAAEARTLRLRAQQCLPPGERLATCPLAGGLRVVRPQPGLMKWGLDLPNPAAGWIACTDLHGSGGLVFLFDKAGTEKAYLYANQDLQTVEWYYQPVAIPPGGKWETSYTIAELSSNAPIVAAGETLALGLTPLALGKADRREVALSALGESIQAELSATAEGLAPVRQSVAVTSAKASTVALPWAGAPVARMTLQTQAGAARLVAAISPQSLDESPLMDLPRPPERLAEFPAATGFFPYAEYFRGMQGAEAGTPTDQVRRQLRAYRRCYMNSYMVGEHAILPAVRDTGHSPICDLVREYGMRLIPRNDMLRRFAKDEAGRQQEQPPPATITREVALERVTAPFSLDLRRKFVAQYGDLVAAYDFSDEPGSEYVPLYLLIQNVYREVDPAHPVLVILNLNRTEFLPYMPIYYGDEYPIRNQKSGGRDPWALAKMVRFCATHTSAPVWVMLQAFGGREEYTWQLPTKPEQQLMLYETIANGGKGITFHGSSSPPCWRYNQYYFYPAIDSWLAETPAWEAMREAGRFITAIGPALLDTRVSDEAVLQVRCAQLEAAGLRKQGPAVLARTLKRREGGWFVVVVNQDIVGKQQAALSANAALVPAGQALYDLHALREASAVPVNGCEVELAPGDGRAFFLGTPAQAAQVMPVVHQGYYDGEQPLYQIDAAQAQANGCDLTVPAAAARSAAAAYAAGDFATAHRGILTARAQLAGAVKRNAALAAALQSIEQAHRLLSELAAAYRDHFDVVVPPADQKAAAGQPLYKNTQDPKMQEYVDKTAEAFLSRLKLEDRLYQGEAPVVAPAAAQLLQDVTTLHAAALPYVTRKG